ncbi:hypothetical protein NDU88_008141 [Pleurodeles waltl]|uniref:Uncharacterized protein n=1 Tax=Pleurodeles waltl TaxID=8319 RepID=A0AAV7VRQ1_PLEWA|nr:hypothetical protein NDU88_008141 [Pleurodeles waltl]
MKTLRPAARPEAAASRDGGPEPGGPPLCTEAAGDSGSPGIPPLTAHSSSLPSPSSPRPEAWGVLVGARWSTRSVREAGDPTRLKD